MLSVSWIMGFREGLITKNHQVSSSKQSAGESLQVRLRSLGHPGGALVGEAPEHLLEAEVNPRGRKNIPVKIPMPIDIWLIFMVQCRWIYVPSVDPVGYWRWTSQKDTKSLLKAPGTPDLIIFFPIPSMPRLFRGHFKSFKLCRDFVCVHKKSGFYNPQNATI